MHTLNNLFNKKNVIHYKKGSLIYQSRDERKKIFLIKNGFIVVYQEDIKNKHKILHVLQKDNIFPLASEILKDNRKTFLQALTDVTLLSIDKNDFFRLVYNNNNYLKLLVTALANYLLLYVERLENLELDTLEKKVIGRLLHFKSKFGKKNGSNIKIELPITHEFIADSINVARENVSRVFSKLQREKTIEFQDGYLIILNEKKLVDKINFGK